MQTSAPARELWLSHLHPAPRAGRVWDRANTHMHTHTHNNLIMCVVWLYIPNTTAFLCALVCFNVPAHLHCWKRLTAALSGSTVCLGGPEAAGSHGRHPPLCFCCAVLKEMRPRGGTLTGSLLGEPHYHLRGAGTSGVHGAHRSAASPADRSRWER